MNLRRSQTSRRQFLLGTGALLGLRRNGAASLAETNASRGVSISASTRELIAIRTSGLVSTFLRESRNLEDYRITGMNLGWEVPGLFDVEMQVRNLSLATEAL